MAISHMLFNTKIKLVKFVRNSCRDSIAERLCAGYLDLEISSLNLAEAQEKFFVQLFFIVNAKDHGVFYFLKRSKLLALLVTL